MGRFLLGLRDTIVKTLSSKTEPSTATISTVRFVQELKQNGKVVIDSQIPFGQKTTPELKRVPKPELEASYVNEPNVFNAINKTCQLILAAWYKVVGDEKSVKFFNEFFDLVGSRGGEMEWEELLSSVIKHQMVYGEAWNELIPAKRDPERIVDIQLLDPKKMDYALDGNNRIVLDSNSDPVGYVETLPPEYTANRRHEAPENVTLDYNQIFFPIDKVAHYKLYTIGDGFYGIGLIEPSYKTIIRKLNMEEALSNAVNRTGFPRLLVEIGDDRHEPTDEMIQRAVEKIRNLNYMGVIGHPNWMKVTVLEAKSPEKLQEHLTYYIKQIVTGTGLPIAFATGVGGEINRSTLNRQEAVAKQTLKDIVRRTVRTIEKQIIEPVALSNGVNPVKIIWGEIAIEGLDGKARRLSSYANTGLLVPDDGIEETIRNLEDLPPMEKNNAARKPKEKNSPDSKEEK